MEIKREPRKTSRTAKFVWTPKRLEAQVRNWAMFKIIGMIGNLARMSRLEVDKMNIPERAPAIKFAILQATRYLEIVRENIKKGNKE